MMMLQALQRIFCSLNFVIFYTLMASPILLSSAPSYTPFPGHFGSSTLVKHQKDIRHRGLNCASEIV